MKVLIPLFLSLMTLSSEVKAELKYPNGLYSPQDMVREFRGVLENKLRELPQNFIVKKSKTDAVFSSDKEEHCFKYHTEARAPLTVISFLSKAKNNKLYQDGKLFGCNKVEIFHESLFAEGSDLSELSLNNYLKGDINITPHKYEKFDYQIKLSNLDNITLFKLSSRKVNNKTFIDYYLFENKFMEVTYEKRSNLELFYITLFPYHINLEHFKSHFDIDVVTTRIERDSNGVRYFDSTNTQIAPSMFTFLFSKYVSGITLNSLTGFIKYYTSYFPTTEQVATGGQNQRIIDELRLSYTNLLNNLDLNYVKNLILEYINAIESGLLKIDDNRPDQ